MLETAAFALSELPVLTTIWFVGSLVIVAVAASKQNIHLFIDFA
jgi:hypothetical protein